MFRGFKFEVHQKKEKKEYVRFYWADQPKQKISENELTARMRPMLDSISHRGPDGEGVFSDAGKHVVLAACRT